jgi:hypothetical protein
MAPEKAIVLLVKTISVTTAFVILSGGVSQAIQNAAGSMRA